MARGSQAELDGIRVDRPMWNGPPDSRPAGPVGRPEVRDRSLPRFSSYVPPGAAFEHPEVDIDLTVFEQPDARWRSESLVAGREVRSGAGTRAAERSNPQQQPSTPVGARPMPVAPPLLHRRLARRARRRVRRSLHHAAERVARPTRARPLDRATVVRSVVVAVLVVLTVVVASTRATLSDRGRFVDAAQAAHRDPAVADRVARELTNALVADDVVPAARALEVHATAADLVRTDEFAPVWRAALGQTHAAATGQGEVVPSTVGQALPGFSPRLRDHQMRGAAVVGDRRVEVVAADVVADLRALLRQLELLAWVLAAAAAAVGVTAFRGAPNRIRTGSLVAVCVAAGSLVAIWALAWASGPMAGVVVDGSSRSIAVAAAGGTVPATRIVLACLGGVAVLLAVAGRVEENRTRPAFSPPSRPRRRVRAHHRRSYPYVAPPHPDLHLDA